MRSAAKAPQWSAAFEASLRGAALRAPRMGQSGPWMRASLCIGMPPVAGSCDTGLCVLTRGRQASAGPQARMSAVPLRAEQRQ